MEVHIPEGVNWAIRTNEGNTNEDNNVLSQAKKIERMVEAYNKNCT